MLVLVVEALRVDRHAYIVEDHSVASRLISVIAATSGSLH